MGGKKSLSGQGAKARGSQEEGPAEGWLWSNQYILKEISPEDSLEELMLKLKLQYFGHLMRRTDSLEKILMLGKIEGGRRRDDRG